MFQLLMKRQRFQHVSLYHTCPCLVRLQEVIRGAARDQRLSPSRRRIELDKGFIEILIDLHDGRLVAAAVTVVGRRKDGHHVHGVGPVVSVHHQLVRARHEAQAVSVVEHFGNVRSEGVTRASGRDAPASSFIGIGPQQVAHGALVRHLLHAVKLPNVIKGVDGRGQAAVQTEDVVVDHSCQRQIVEQICEVLPDVSRTVLADTLVKESVNLGNLSTLVISSQQMHAVWVACF
mmetsp:Transcript_54612/g.95484  ORF Transcript_54612/g.95484 Transcript_54612/m.95484 type:complete len:233 (+) Transcript_54612:104-802(+)